MRLFIKPLGNMKLGMMACTLKSKLRISKLADIAAEIAWYRKHNDMVQEGNAQCEGRANSRSGKRRGRTVEVEKELVVEAEHQTNVTQCHAVVKRQTSKWSVQDLK